MKNKIVILIVLLVCQSVSFGGEPNDSNLPVQKEVIQTIEKLNSAVAKLRQLTAQVEYIHAQPLFDTQTIRTGDIFYVKDVNCTALRMNFLTIKQDQSPRLNYREDYIFDGMKLTKIDYQGKSAITEQLSKDKPIEPFELVQDYFPIIGLAKPDEMTGQFNITVSQSVLCLIPKENSKFFKTYKHIEITINPVNSLPCDFSAVTSEDEKITIKLSQIDTSTAVKNSVFDMNIPADFVKTQK
ncbi:MAG: hypothetical protein WC496_01460 [Phycisphaerae bacterium]|jgi:outer membrane lipoprotein-sorting protein